MISQQQFMHLVPTVCSKETSSDPIGWTDQNPLYGHCVPVTLLAQDLFGGEIAKVSLEGSSYRNMKSHFLNVINGVPVDFSQAQFGGEVPYSISEMIIGERDKVIAQGNTQERYEVLKKRFLNTHEILD